MSTDSDTFHLSFGKHIYDSFKLWFHISYAFIMMSFQDIIHAFMTISAGFLYNVFCLKTTQLSSCDLILVRSWLLWCLVKSTTNTLYCLCKKPFNCYIICLWAILVMEFWHQIISFTVIVPHLISKSQSQSQTHSHTHTH